jgi:ketosteroid isomerase-like protein
VVDNIEDFRALDPFFRIIEEGLRVYVDGDHFFDLLAEDVVGYPYSNRYISVVGIKDRKVSWWRDYLDPLRVFAALEGRPFEPDGAEANRSAASLVPT